MKYSGVGGQAVLEGVMMRNGSKYAVAVRKPDGGIAVKYEKQKERSEFGEKCRKIPFVRGVIAFVDSISLGLKTLEYSVSFLEEEEAAEKARAASGGEPAEKTAEKNDGKKDSMMMAVSLVLAAALCVGLFILLPMFLVSLLRPIIQNRFLISLFEGILRVAIFLAYIVLISKMKDIRRVFMYHGAEHKCINCIEHGLPLDVSHVRASSRQHKRCGTSFLLFVMLVSVFVGIFLPKDILWQRLLSRLIMLPLVMGISYEIIRWAGSTDSKFADVMSKPGLWLQKTFTTREPEDDMIEVGIASVNAVFDWKAWQEKELGIVFEEENAPREGSGAANEKEGGNDL